MLNTDSLYSYRFFLYMILAAILIFFICDWCNKNNRQYSLQVKHGLNEIIKEASRVSTSGKQNENPLLGVMQNSEAVGMMKAAKLLAPEEDLQRLTSGVPIVETEREMKEQQTESAKNLIRKCSNLLPASRLAELAGLYPYSKNNQDNQQGDENLN